MTSTGGACGPSAEASGRPTRRPIVSLGHGTAEQGAFAELVISAGIEIVVDVRRHPGSRRHPHFGREAMERWLPEAGVAYTWLPALGGRRRVGPDSIHTGLRNEQFRAYAEHMGTDEFRGGISELQDLAGGAPAAVLCSESVWWRCHRRLLADHLILVEGVGVDHLFHDGRLFPHAPTPVARLDGDRVVYDADTPDTPDPPDPPDPPG